MNEIRTNISHQSMFFACDRTEIVLRSLIKAKTFKNAHRDESIEIAPTHTAARVYGEEYTLFGRPSLVSLLCCDPNEMLNEKETQKTSPPFISHISRRVSLNDCLEFFLYSTSFLLSGRPVCGGNVFPVTIFPRLSVVCSFRSNELARAHVRRSMYSQAIHTQSVDTEAIVNAHVVSFARHFAFLAASAGRARL